MILFIHVKMIYLGGSISILLHNPSIYLKFVYSVIKLWYSQLGYRLDDQGAEVYFQGGARDFSLHYIQTGSGVHPAFYTMDTRGYFP
jgi:hypothetical protein